MKENNTNRRKFLKTTVTAGAAFGFPTIIPSRAMGNADVPAPSNRIVVGGIGLGNMGAGDLSAFLGKPDVQYVAVCEVRKGVLEKRKAQVNQKNNNQDCAAYVDYRELLARPDIDAVHIATPDHWHAVQIIDACRAGKDVFCQKPETRIMREGPLVVEAARRYDRVVSGGSQRVLEDYRRQVHDCWSGKLGTIKSVNVNVNPLSQPCNLPPEPTPDDINWELWLGPAPWAPYNAQRCSGAFSTSGGSWRSYIDYSGGGMTDWGAHHFGGAAFMVDVMDLQPSEIILAEEDGKKFVTMKFPNGVTITHNKPKTPNLKVESDPAQPKTPKEMLGYATKGGITADFLDCVKTRKKPFRDIERAVNTMAVCHLATIAYRVGRTLKWDAAKQVIVGDEEANRYLDSARREPWQI